MYISSRRPLPKSLEKRILEVKDYEGEYEYERDYLKVLDRIKETNPFSILVFYESHRKARTQAEKVVRGSCMYEQFYFIPELRQRRRGNWMGSGYRTTQSVYACALSMMPQVPTHILIYGKELHHVLSSRTLVVQPHDVTQEVRREEADDILKDTRKAFAIRKGDDVESILVIY